MKDITKSFKENGGAIVTALVMFLIVLYYLLVLVPNQKDTLDKYNRDLLGEFGKQVEITFKDYANKIDTSILASSALLNPPPVLSDSNSNSKSVVTKIIEEKKNIYSLVIHTVTITEVTVKQKEIELSTKLVMSTKADTSKKSIINTVQSILFNEFKERLLGAVPFNAWVIFTEKGSEKEVFLAHNLEDYEYDSLRLSKIHADHYLFKNTDKRFYKKSLFINGQSIKFIIAGAVNIEDFEAEAKSLDVSEGVAGIVIVLLLFLGIPLVKPIISSKNEKLTQFDLVNSVSCIWLASIVLSLFIVSVYLRKVNLAKIENDLRSYNAELRTNLTKEIHFNLDYLNDFIRELFLLRDDRINSSSKIKALDREKLVKWKCDTSSRFEVMFALDRNAYMIKEIRRDTRYTLTKNYRERDYYKKLFQKNHSLTFSSVYSKSDNNFELIAAVKDSVHNVLIGLAYKPILSYKIKSKQDYGFIVCNKEGRVLLHSDRRKNLNENIYNITHQPYEILKILRGNNHVGFDLNYNSEHTRFFSASLNYGNAVYKNTSPIYVFTFKKLDFEERLDLYSVIYSLSLCLGYVILLAISLLLYSVVYNYTHITVFSKSHIYWLFPDIGRTPEYRFLFKVNLITIVLIALISLSFPEHAIYICFIIGLNAGFFNFVLLAQKQNDFSSFIKLNNPAFLSLISTIFFSVLISLGLCSIKFPSLATPITLIAHVLFLRLFNKKLRPRTLDIKTNQNTKKYNSYKPYLWSNLLVHNIAIPITLLLFLFAQELLKVEQYNQSYSEPNKALVENWREPIDRFHSMFGINPPSSTVLKYKDFDQLNPPIETRPLLALVLANQNLSKSILLFLILAVFLIIIHQLISFYSGRFFFFELSEWYTSLENKTVHPLTNMGIISPPFSFKEIVHLYTGEGQIKKETADSYKYMYRSCSSPIYKILDLIIQDRIAENKNEYEKIWILLSKEEKFVIHDFAGDYFVNYKNRNILAGLIKNGYIIADPSTGRLRLMNYSFRKFIIEHEQKDPLFSAQEIETSHKGTFAKWRIPLLIIAISVLLVVVFVFQESYNNILIIGGSVFSTIALIARFLNNYKR